MSENSGKNDIQLAILEASDKILKDTSIARPQINLYEEWVKAGKPMLDPEAVERIYEEGIEKAVMFHKCLNQEECKND